MRCIVLVTIKKEMTLAADLFDELKAKYFADDPEFKERSWGMSHDYDIAVECSSTMVLVPSVLCCRSRTNGISQ